MTCSILGTFQNGEDSVVQINSELSSQFNNGHNNELFSQYKSVILNSLITAFGLDRILFADKDGGNVQTVHNAKNRVYANKTFEIRGEREYNRDDYAPASYMKSQRKEHFKNNAKIYDGYTGKELPKDGRAHLEHIVSAKEIHDDTAARILFSKEKLSNLINSDDNTTYTDASLNMSKNDSKLRDWASKQNKKKPDMTNVQYHGLNEEIAYAADARARKHISQEVAQETFEHYVKSMKEDSLKQGGATAIRQSLGLVFTEVAIVVMDEIPV